MQSLRRTNNSWKENYISLSHFENSVRYSTKCINICFFLKDAFKISIGFQHLKTAKMYPSLRKIVTKKGLVQNHSSYRLPSAGKTRLQHPFRAPAFSEFQKRTASLSLGPQLLTLLKKLGLKSPLHTYYF